jgi:hypothetical protein
MSNVRRAYEQTYGKLMYYLDKHMNALTLDNKVESGGLVPTTTYISMNLHMNYVMLMPMNK